MTERLARAVVFLLVVVELSDQNGREQEAAYELLRNRMNPVLRSKLFHRQSAIVRIGIK